MTTRRPARHERRGLILLLVAVVGGLVWRSPAAQPAEQLALENQPGLCRASRFINGDTIEVNIQGTPKKVCFIGVDTPETHKPNTAVQCYGPAAAHIKAVIGQLHVQQESDGRRRLGVQYCRLINRRNW